MSRSVEDLATALRIIAGVDWRDSGVVPMPIRSHQEVVRQEARVAVYWDDGEVSPSGETVEAVTTAARILREAGARVEEKRPESIEESISLTTRFWRRTALTGDEFDDLLLAWDKYRSRMLGFIEEFDAIVCPVYHDAAVPHGGIADDDPGVLGTYTFPYSLTGWPVVVVRAGTSHAGLPIGVQVVARPWREDALAVARCIEVATQDWPEPVV